MKLQPTSTALLIALLPALAAPHLATARDDKAMSEKDCRNINFPSSEERLVRACDAQYAMCANPPPAWQEVRQVLRVCELIKHEQQLQAAKPGVPGALLTRPMTRALPTPEVAPGVPATAAPATPTFAAPALRALPAQVAPATMPAQPAAVFNASSPDDAVLAPYPRGFDIAPGGRRFDGFAAGQPGPVRVMVRSAQPVVVALRRPDGRLIERAGSGDFAIDDAATDADVRAGLLWGVSIRPQQPGSGAQGQIMVSAPAADPQAVRAVLERDRQAAAQQAQAALAAQPAPAVDASAVLASRQRELDQQALARHSAALRQIQTQLHPDTAAVMTQAQQARAQGQPLAQVQGAMISDARIAKLVGAGALSAAAPAGNQFVAPASGRLLAAPVGVAGANAPGVATPQGGGATAQVGGTPASAPVAGAVDRMFKRDGTAAAPAASGPQQVVARPLVASTSVSEGDPGTPVMIQGSNFGNARGEVRFIVANGRDLPAPITFWSATQIVTEVPATEGVREFPGQVYVKRADGTQSDLRPFGFRPAMERRQLVPPAKTAWSSNGILDARIHPYAVHFSGPSRTDITDGSFLPVVSRATALFGGAGRDEYFLSGQLANGWRVESCVVGDYRRGSIGPRVTSGQATVTVAQCPVGTERMRTAVDWWFDFQSGFSYSLTLNIVGPKGIPHQ